jgi:hypothetical protein
MLKFNNKLRSLFVRQKRVTYSRKSPVSFAVPFLPVSLYISLSVSEYISPAPAELIMKKSDFENIKKHIDKLQFFEIRHFI